MINGNQHTFGGERRRHFESSPWPHRLVGAAPALAIAALAVAIGLVAAAAQAQVASTSGSAVAVPRATVAAAGSVDEGSFDSDTEIRVFLERENIELIGGVSVDITSDGTYSLPLSPGVLAAGETVTSVMIHADRVGSFPYLNLNGTVEFNADILGIVVSDAQLDIWDPIVGLPVIAYPTGLTYRGLELDPATPEHDEITLSGRTLELRLRTSTYVDQIRVLLATTPHGVSFSIDAQGPSFGAAASFGAANLTAAGVLTPGAAGAPGPNEPVPGPTVAPGVMLTPAALGIANGGAGGVREVDALSFGHDRGGRLRFSVDEFAVGDALGVAPDVRSEGALPGSNVEASADVFAFLGPLAPTTPLFVPGNRAALDGDGVAPSGRRGLGLIEPNAPSFQALPDMGDNLDGLDLGTTTAHLAGPVYFSLDAGFRDPAETAGGPPPNFGTAPANGFSGADVLVTMPGSGVVLVYASAAALGLDCNGQCNDDIDALALWDDGDGVFNPAVDRILFSLRRNSGSLGMLDGRLGLPITEADVLTPGPDILIPGESVGLNTTRSGWLPPLMVPDDLDALDRVQVSGGPVGNPDNQMILRGGQQIIDVVANDVALVGQIDPASVMIFDLPQHGTILGINQATGAIQYRHDGSATVLDSFTYVVFDGFGECSEPTTVRLIVSLTGVEDEQPHGRDTRPVISFAGPNPFGTKTAFMVKPSRSGQVLVAVYDMTGRLVRTLLDEHLAAGEMRRLEWDGRDESRAPTAASMYLVRMKSPDGEKMLPVVRLK